MKTLALFFCLFSALPFFAQNQLEQSLSVRADGADADASAMLDVQSTTQGMLIPRMTNAEIAAIADPATGLQVYSTDDHCIHRYDGSRWLMDCALEYSTNTLPPAGDNWMQLNDFPAGFDERNRAVTFTIDNVAYVGTGRASGNTYKKDLWKYDPDTDIWTQLNDFPAGFEERSGAVAFTIGNVAYVGTGYANGNTRKKDLWKYDQGTDSWTQMNDFPADFKERIRAVAFTIGNAAYVGTGIANGSSNQKDLWKYDSITDTWTRLNDFPASFARRNGAIALTLGGFAYVGTGISANSTYKKDFWKYDEAMDTWTQLGDFPSGFNGRRGVAAFVLSGSAYATTGDRNSTFENDLWKYDLTTDTWAQLNDLPAGFDARRYSLAFTIGDVAYVGTGDIDGTNYKKDLWKYSPNQNPHLLTINPDGAATWVEPEELAITETDPEVGDNSTNYLPKWDGSALVQSSSVFEDGSGMVGIGTNTPGEALEVDGNIFASNGDLYTEMGSGVINAGGGIMSSSINIIADSAPSPSNADGDEDLYIEDVLEVAGSAHKPGGGIWLGISDARLKKDIQPYSDGLAEIMQINPVRYRYNDITKIPDPEREFIGIIAQEMQAIAPYMVKEFPLGQRTTEDENGNEIITEPGTPYLTFDGSALTYMLVNAVQEQQAEIEKSRMENEALRMTNVELEQRLAKLEAAFFQNEKAKGED